jgi:hypothetical protein
LCSKPGKVRSRRCVIGPRARGRVRIRRPALSLPNLSGVGPVDLLLRYHPAMRCTVTIVYVA